MTDGAMDPGGGVGTSNSSVENMDEIGEETMLTDGPNDPVSNADANNDGLVEYMNEIGEETVSDAGANNGLVKNMEEIGIIFDVDGVEKKVPLKEIGSYVKFNKECRHKGYKTGKKTTFLSAQIFSAPIGNRRLVQSNLPIFEEGLLHKDDISRLENISEKIQQGWEKKYKSKKYKAPKKFQSRKINQDKTRKIDQQYFKDPDLDEVKQLIKMFETIYQNTIRVVEVWFLKKRSKKDGFEKFHYDFGSVRGGHNDVSSTIVVNLGVFHEEEEEEEEELEEDSEDEESDDEDGQVKESSGAMGEQCDGYQVSPSLRKPGLPKEVEGVEGRRRDFQEALMRDITPEEELFIHQSINQDLKLPWGISSQDLSKLREGSINMDIIQVYLTRFLSQQDEKLCEKDPTRSKSVYYPYFLQAY